MITFLHLFWWPSLKKDGWEYVSTCQVCPKNKASSSIPLTCSGGLGPTYPWTSSPAFPPQHVTQSSLLLLTGFLKQPTSSPYPTAIHTGDSLANDQSCLPAAWDSFGISCRMVALSLPAGCEKIFFFFGFHSSWYSCQFFSLSTLGLSLLSLPICVLVCGYRTFQRRNPLGPHPLAWHID